MKTVLEKYRPLFHPRSLAVIGASNTRGKWGYIYSRNLQQGGFPGTVYPVNLTEKEILGRPAYPSVDKIPGPVDLALILLPPRLVRDAVLDCLRKKVGAIVVITAGFGELGAEGRRLQAEFAGPALAAGIPLIGPNCMGLVHVQAQLNAQLFFLNPRAGKISILSQSGNLGGNLIRRGMADGIGFSKFVSSGNEAVTTCEDLLEYFAADPETAVLLVYVEGVKDGRRFLSAAQKVTAVKPVVLLKGGYTEGGAKACASHTGAMAGAREVFEAGCRQAGILRVDDTDDLYYVGTALAALPLPPGGRTGIVTEGGGLGVIAADACLSHGLTVPPLEPDMIAAFDRVMPDRWSRNNPVDTAAGDGKFAALEAIINSPAFDALISVGAAGSGQTLQALKAGGQTAADPEAQARLARVERRVAEEMEEAKKIVGLIERTGKPIVCSDLAVSLGPTAGNPVLEWLAERGLLVYRDTYQAAKVLGYLHRYAAYRRALGPSR